METGVLICHTKDLQPTVWEGMTPEATVAKESPGRRLPGILVVDDDPVLGRILNGLLQEDGFAVWLTSDGYQAIKIYWGHRDDIDLVLLDVRMPGLDGPETMAALQEVDPHLPCCFMSGDLGRYTERDLLERGAKRILYKPFRLADLRQVLRTVLTSAGSRCAE